MGFFRRRKGPARATTVADVMPKVEEKGAEGRNPPYEQFLKDTFGISPAGNQWAYDGQSVDLSAQLRDPSITHGVLKNLKVEVGFGRICIVATPQTVFIACDRKPPIGLVTSLSSDGVGPLMAAILKETPGAELNEYLGTWVLPI